MESDIIIVNHHLFFADLSIKQQAEYAPDAGILPEVGAVIFDEAHELEDVAGSYFGVSVSNARVEELCRDVEVSLQRNHMLSASISGALKSLRERSPFFFALAAAGRRPLRFREPARVPGGKRRRIPGLAAVARPAGLGTGKPAVEAGGSLQLCPARAGAAGAAWVPDGIGRPQYRVLDRAPARRAATGKTFSCRPRRSMWRRF